MLTELLNFMKQLMQHKTKKVKFRKLKKDLHWLDAVSDTGWLSKEEMDKMKPAEAVCCQMYVYKEDKDSITLFANYNIDPDGNIEYGEVICIPKKWM